MQVYFIILRVLLNILNIHATERIGPLLMHAHNTLVFFPSARHFIINSQCSQS